MVKGFKRFIDITKLKQFKFGGAVRATGPVMAHDGEFVLPKGIRPTPKQRLQIKEKKRRARK